MLMKHTTALGAHSPNIVWEKLRSWQLVCLPTLHLLSLDCLRRGFRRTPTNHTMRLTWTLLTMPPLNYTITGTLLLHSTIFRWTRHLLLTEVNAFGIRIPSVIVNSQTLCPISRHPSGGTPWAGSRISLPILGKVINCYNGHLLVSCVISYSLPILYHNWSGKSSVYVIFFILFITFYLGPMIHLVNSYWPTPYYTTLFLFVKRGSRGGACGVGCTELTMYLFHSLSFIDCKRC